MGLLDSILGAMNKQTEATGGANPLIGVLGGLLEQSGGLQGLMNKFSQSGHGNTFGSWVGMNENQPISGDEIQKVLGSEQISSLAAKLGIDPNQAAHLLAEYLPKVVDKMTPEGKVDPNADHQQALANLIPALLQSFGGKPNP
ncbi:MAG: YidB family protein [Verrucomicrobiota bacterium]